MQTRIVLLLAALLAVLALVATPARAEAALSAVEAEAETEAEAEAEAEAGDEVDDTAESEMLDEVEGEAELDAEEAEEAGDSDEAEDEEQFEMENVVDDEGDMEGAVEAEVVESELLELLPGHKANGKCPKVDACPVCPGLAAVVSDRETQAAAKAYMHEFGDSDAVADMTVRDTVRPAFMAGVAFADESVRKAAKAARTSYRHSVELLDAHRHYKAVPKGCPKLPAKLDCRCKPFTRLAHLPETSRKALDYSMTVRDADTSYWWSMNEAVRDAFLEGVKYNDRERAIRQSANEVVPAGATNAQKMENLQKRLDAINTRIQNQRQPKDT